MFHEKLGRVVHVSHFRKGKIILSMIFEWFLENYMRKR